MPPDTSRNGPWPTAATRLFVVFGDPVQHSLSPKIHNAAFRADGLDCVYLTWHTDTAHFATAVDTCIRAGVAGANVTVPHKQAAFALCDQRSDAAELIGAVNTLVFRDGNIIGDNTDVGGFGDDLDTLTDISDATPVTVFGTGGAARAVVVACGIRHAPVTIVGRRAAAAHELATLATAAGATTANAVIVEDPAVSRHVADSHVVINATVLGLQHETLPAAFMQLHPGQLAYDLIYAPPLTPFLAAAQQNGANWQNGAAMLVNQAARAYTLFTGQPAPKTAMQHALADTPA